MINVMARQEFKAQIVSIKDLTPSVRELTLQPQHPEGLSFEGGQFVMLHLPDPGRPEKPALRAYSIASPNSEKSQFRLIIKHFEGGLASAWVRSLKGNEEVTYTGPFGKFLLRTPPAPSVVFVCTSTGLAPFISMLQSQGHKFSDHTFELYMGVWKQQEIFYKNALDQLSKDLPHFDYFYVLDAPEDGWDGLTGFVTTHIEKLDLNVPKEFYLCGNPAMIKGVKEMLLSKGFPKEKIYTESYG